MTEEQKKILLIDLSGRLPYRIKGNYQNSDDELLRKVTIIYRYLEPNGMVMTGDIKPYLFPLSNLTDKQLEEMYDTCGIWVFNKEEPLEFRFDGYEFSDFGRVIDWFNEHHFDYRGLIEKGLAIDATGLNIYDKK